MKKKITIKLKKSTIDRAKKYAKQNKQSLSVMVENYFNILSKKSRNDEIEISPNVLELSGIIKLSGEINLKNIYGKHLERGTHAPIRST